MVSYKNGDIVIEMGAASLLLLSSKKEEYRMEEAGSSDFIEKFPFL